MLIAVTRTAGRFTLITGGGVSLACLSAASTQVRECNAFLFTGVLTSLSATSMSRAAHFQVANKLGARFIGLSSTPLIKDRGDQGPPSLSPQTNRSAEFHISER